MGSPLGKYGQVVAAVIAVGVIATYLIAIIFRNALGLESSDLASLRDIALIAVGAVFGATATINGVKAPIESAHSRIDRLQEATGVETHGSHPLERSARDPSPPASPSP